MNVLKEFKPLYETPFYIADAWGGRAGARSYHITQYALSQVLYNLDFRGFFLREVHSTIYTSLWQDFKDRIKDFEEIHKVDLSKTLEWSDNKSGTNTCVNKKTGATISTKGFKTSSGNQTASLKSLAGGTHIFIDEADEVEEKEFNKLLISLRKKGVKIQILRAFNPPHKEHWIWKDYNLTPSEHDGYLKATSKEERHLSIFTTYHCNKSNLNIEAIRSMEKLKETSPQEYYNQILGLIPSKKTGMVYSNWGRISTEDYDNLDPKKIVYGLDFGSSSPTALVEVKFLDDKRYIKQLIYQPGNELNLGDRICELLPNGGDIVADSAEPLTIAELRRHFARHNPNIRIYGAIKGPGSILSRTKEVQKLKVFVEESSNDIWEEYLGLVWDERYVKEVRKGDDHGIDAFEYANQKRL